MKPNAAAYAESAEMDAAMWDDAGDVDPMTDDERAADEARATAAIHREWDAMYALAAFERAPDAMPGRYVGTDSEPPF